MPNNKKTTQDNGNNETASTKKEAEKTDADFDQTIREAEGDTKTRKPGSSGDNQNNQHNNGRGGLLRDKKKAIVR